MGYGKRKDLNHHGMTMKIPGPGTYSIPSCFDKYKTFNPETN